MAIQEIINQKTSEHGYQVRVKGRTRYFSIKKYGGKRATLKEAKLAEQEILKEMGLKSSSERLPQENIGKRNTSGVLGIHIQWRVHHQSINAYAYLSGSWKDKEGNSRMFGYSIDKHGLKGALKMAIAKRKIAKLPVPDINEAHKILTEKLKC